MILIVDDDYSINVSLGLLLKQAGYKSISVETPEKALEALAENDISLVLQDMNFSLATTGEEGLHLLANIRSAHPEVPVMLMTAWGSIELAVRGMQAGASDFITKPWSKKQILQSVGTALGLAATREKDVRTGRLSRQDLDDRFDFSGIVGESPLLLEVLALVGRVSGTDASVLITGESGTGKEAVAEAVHRNSPRHAAPFVKVNLGGIPNSLFESEMFGHVRGAFTDAHRDRRGRFATAEGGTILLDEIGDLDPRSQVKMLRVLQDRTYEILGSSVTETMDVRVVSATNHNLTEAVEKGGFREDLFYRLNLITLRIPSLAERTDDIPRLVHHFLRMMDETYKDRRTEVSDPAIEWLQNRDWPGNIRQLKHLIERTCLVFGDETLQPEHFRRTENMDLGATGGDRFPPVGSMTVDGMEKTMILKSLKHHDGNLTRVAESLGLSRTALYRRLEKYGIGK